MPNGFNSLAEGLGTKDLQLFPFDNSHFRKYGSKVKASDVGGRYTVTEVSETCSVGVVSRNASKATPSAKTS